MLPSSFLNYQPIPWQLVLYYICCWVTTLSTKQWQFSHLFVQARWIHSAYQEFCHLKIGFAPKGSKRIVGSSQFCQHFSGAFFMICLFSRELHFPYQLALLSRWFSKLPVWWDMWSFPGGYLKHSKTYIFSKITLDPDLAWFLFRFHMSIAWCKKNQQSKENPNKPLEHTTCLWRKSFHV